MPPVYILGVGLTPFTHPSPTSPSYPTLTLHALTLALLDANLTFDAIEAAIASYIFGTSTCGQRAFYQLGMTGIPIFNVNNNCASGSSALFLAREMMKAEGGRDVAMVLGWEGMEPGALGGGRAKEKGKGEDEGAKRRREKEEEGNPIGLMGRRMVERDGVGSGPLMAQMFGNAGREYMRQNPSARVEDFAEIARINRTHGSRNPYAQFKKPVSLEDVMRSRMLHDPLTKMQACPTSDGAAAAVLVSERWLKEHEEYRAQAVEIRGMGMVTDAPDMYEGDAMTLVGTGMTRRAKDIALREAGVRVEDVGVVELHDCFSANEMVTLPGLGLCVEGEAHEMVRRGDITYGGKYVVNPSGGLISKGHPIGATGIAQAAELVWQLRGQAGERLVKGTRFGMQHNLGLGGACVVGVYARADGKANDVVGDKEVGRRDRLAYNPAIEARLPTWEQIESVRSKRASCNYALGGLAKERAVKL